MNDDERQLLLSIDSKVTEIVEWKKAVNDLLYGSIKGEFGYFHKSNIIWRILILWPVMIMSIGFGALLTYGIQQFLIHK